MLNIHVVSVSCGAEHTLALCQEGVSVVSVVWGRAHTGSLSGRGECSQCGVGQSTHWLSVRKG